MVQSWWSLSTLRCWARWADAKRFYVLIARFETENNIETILDGFVASGSQLPLL